MAITMNLSGNGYFAVPGGYPRKLTALGQTMMSGIVPPGVFSVSAVVYADKQANVHMAIYTMPSTANGSDGAIVTDVDSSGTVTKTYQSDITALLSTAQTITLALPKTKAPAPYVVRLWVDGITGTALDTIDRNGNSLTSDEPPIPFGVNVSSVGVA